MGWFIIFLIAVGVGIYALANKKKIKEDYGDKEMNTPTTVVMLFVLVFMVAVLFWIIGAIVD